MGIGAPGVPTALSGFPEGPLLRVWRVSRYGQVEGVCQDPAAPQHTEGESGAGGGRAVARAALLQRPKRRPLPEFYVDDEADLDCECSACLAPPPVVTGWLVFPSQSDGPQRPAAGRSHDDPHGWRKFGGTAHLSLCQACWFCCAWRSGVTVHSSLLRVHASDALGDPVPPGSANFILRGAWNW